MKSDPPDFFKPDGLQFDCTRCQRCCRIEPGYVLLSDADLHRIAAELSLTREEVVKRFTREVRLAGVGRLSLTERANYDCVFWADGSCTIYASRPLQCRSFPFWEDHLSSPEAWEMAAAECPGIGRGPRRSPQEIDYWRRRRQQQPPVSLHHEPTK